eukprot:326607-Amphidinium_carterae.3
MWLQFGKIPGSYWENGTDDRHSWYNFHTEIQYAMNDFINIYLYNYPMEYSQPSLQLTSQPYYLTFYSKTYDLHKDEVQIGTGDFGYAPPDTRRTNWTRVQRQDDQHRGVHGVQDYVSTTI